MWKGKSFPFFFLQLFRYYSPDKVLCSKIRRIPHDNVVISPDGRSLQVVGAQSGNIGCYMVVANSEVGEEVAQRGYLDLLISQQQQQQQQQEKQEQQKEPTLHRAKDSPNALVVLFGCFTVALMILVTLLSFLLYKHKQKHLDESATDSLF